jgi:hypothetical protein
MKVTQGVQVAEGLKKRIRETTTNSGFTPPATTSSLSSPTLTHTNDRKCNHNSEYEMIDFIVLVDLNNDKELSDAYQHCLNGNQLVNRIKAFVNNE